jgi:hypothetical protein
MEVPDPQKKVKFPRSLHCQTRKQQNADLQCTLQTKVFIRKMLVSRKVKKLSRKQINSYFIFFSFESFMHKTSP